MKNYNEATYNEVIDILKEFQQKYPISGIPDFLTLIKTFKVDQFKQIAENWTDFANPGAYFIFSK